MFGALAVVLRRRAARSSGTADGACSVGGGSSAGVARQLRASSLGARSRAVRRLASSLNALRSTGVRAGGFSGPAPTTRNGTTFSDGGTTDSAGALVAEHRRLDARFGCGGSDRGGAAGAALRSRVSSAMRATSRQTPKPR